MRTLEELKNAAFEYVIELGRNCDGGTVPKEIYNDYSELLSPYKRGDTVWFLHDNEVCKGVIKRAVLDWCGTEKMRLQLQDEAGEEMLYGEWLFDDMVFPTKEKLVEYFKELLGL